MSEHYDFWFPRRNSKTFANIVVAEKVLQVMLSNTSAFLRNAYPLVNLDSAGNSFVFLYSFRANRKCSLIFGLYSKKRNTVFLLISVKVSVIVKFTEIGSVEY